MASSKKNEISIEEQRRIFSKNLKKYISISGKQQKEIAEAIGVNSSTFNMWCNGNSIPGPGKLGTLARYFRIGISDLVDEKNNIDPDIEFGDVIAKIERSDLRFKNIILEYDKLSPDKKDLICDFFETFIF